MKTEFLLEDEREIAKCVFDQLPSIANKHDVQILLSRLADLREQQRWIPCAERMPQWGRPDIPAMNVLVYGEGVIDTAYVREDHWELERTGPHDTPIRYEFASGVITHWRPLPAPPEGGVLRQMYSRPEGERMSVEKAREFMAAELAKLPICLGYPDCDWLVSSEHSENCPMFGKEDIQVPSVPELMDAYARQYAAGELKAAADALCRRQSELTCSGAIGFIRARTAELEG